MNLEAEIALLKARVEHLEGIVHRLAFEQAVATVTTRQPSWWRRLWGST
jgi:hypothetical protein